MRATEPPRQVILSAILVVVAAIALAWALYAVRQALVLIYVSVLLAIGFSPLVRFIERRPRLAVGTRVPRWLAILIVYFTILGVVAAIAAIILPVLLVQARDFANYLPQEVQRAQRWLIAHGALREERSLGEIVEQQAAGAPDVVGTMLVTFWGLFGGLIGVVTIVILTFYLLVDSGSAFAGIVWFFPPERRQRLDAISRQITSKVSAWLVGQLMLASIIGVTSAVWLGALGMPYFYVLALIAAIGEFIPIMGPILAAVPGILIAAGQSWRFAVVVGVLYLLQQQLEANVFVPKMMERQVGLTPVTIMIALLLGGALLGVQGAILAVPTAAIVQVVLNELLVDEVRAKPVAEKRTASG